MSAATIKLPSRPAGITRSQAFLCLDLAETGRLIANRPVVERLVDDGFVVAPERRPGPGCLWDARLTELGWSVAREYRARLAADRRDRERQARR